MPGTGETWDDRQAGKGRNAVAQGGLLAADLTRISKTEEKKRDDGDFPRSHAEDPGRLSPPPWRPSVPARPERTVPRLLGVSGRRGNNATKRGVSRQPKMAVRYPRRAASPPRSLVSGKRLASTAGKQKQE